MLLLAHLRLVARAEAAGVALHRGGIVVARPLPYPEMVAAVQEVPELEELPEHHGEPAPLDRWMSEAVERAIGTRSLGGDMM